MKVVIVGGSGNISTSIVAQLIEQNYEVVCYNRGQTQLEPLPDSVRQLHGDRRQDRKAFEQMMLEEKPDVAIDMVCFSEEDALSDLRAFPDVKKFIFCSTVCVYGQPSNIFPITEDMEPMPNTGYGKGKKAAEEIFNCTYRMTEYPVTILRPNTTYGNQVGLVSSVGSNSVWIDRVKKGKPLLVCGSGNNLHQYMHVRDAATAFVQAIELPHTNGKTYNLVGEGYSDWNTYYETGMRILGKNVPLIGISLDMMKALGEQKFGYACEIFAHNAYYSNVKLNRDFPNFKQSISLEDGMREVISWCEEHGTIPNCDSEPIDDLIIDEMIRIREKLAQA